MDKEEFDFEAKKRIKRAVESFKQSDKIKFMLENLAEIKRKRSIDQLKEISKYGLY